MKEVRAIDTIILLKGKTLISGLVGFVHDHETGEKFTQIVSNTKYSRKHWIKQKGKIEDILITYIPKPREKAGDN